MPEMDGIQATQAIRALNADWVPIIFLSAQVEPEDINRGIDAGGRRLPDEARRSLGTHCKNESHGAYC